MQRFAMFTGAALLAMFVLITVGASPEASSDPRTASPAAEAAAGPSVEAAADRDAADGEDAAIRAAIQRYLDGTSYSRPEQIASAFYDQADLFLSHPEEEIYIRSIREYLGFFENREVGKFNGREGEILAIDREHDIATAKAEIRLEEGAVRYIDLFLLKKLEGEWKIISKAATRMP